MKKPSLLSANLYSAVACLVFACAELACAQNLVLNGSFENISNTFVPDGNYAMSLPAGSTVIPYWTTTNAELLWVPNTNVFGPTTPFGSFFLDFTGYHDSFPYGGVTQTLATTPGQTYEVSFSLGQYQEDSIYAGPVSVTAIVGSVVESTNTFTPTNSSGNQWMTFQVDFTAQSSSTLINITGVSAHGGQYLGLDNASLTVQGGGPELLVNGSFEEGAFVNQEDDVMSLPVGSTNIIGWTTTAAGIAWGNNSNAFGLLTPYGSMFLDLTGLHDSLPYGGVAQTVATVPGQAYTLSFSLGVDQSVGAYSGPVSALATIESGSVFATTPNGGDWQSFSFGFTAVGTATPLSFIGASTLGGRYIGFDNVSVTPASAALVITSIESFEKTNLVLGFNSQLGTNYAVQSTANLASTWTAVAGSTNSGTGGIVFLTLTNAISAAEQFYRIKQLP